MQCIALIIITPFTWLLLHTGGALKTDQGGANQLEQQLGAGGGHGIGLNGTYSQMEGGVGGPESPALQPPVFSGGQGPNGNQVGGHAGTALCGRHITPLEAASQL